MDGLIVDLEFVDGVTFVRFKIVTVGVKTKSLRLFCPLITPVGWKVQASRLHPTILLTNNESNQILPSTSLYYTIFINNIIPIQLLFKNYHGMEHLTYKHH